MKNRQKNLIIQDKLLGVFIKLKNYILELYA